ncbi:alanine racemase [Parendozoicomonas haliclonae]|uniref:Alanine racemase N-terminal domain-containing protein n=1 Tax=Parendozoicomonas haliclonae TaxID=1960125 RepID=A0A1X7AH46_9GAMM|nr:alanine racemase [Parendozoicomonas haliclonae]SMA40168.1 hypothetical protein EHSB41UT_01149 [Parendozoicomonas haliclonae]
MKLLLLLAALAGYFWWRRDRGEPHSLYFQQLQNTLKEAGVCYPRMVLDLDRLDGNIEKVKNFVGDTSHLRVVGKSLPSFELLEYIQNKLGTNRLMVFHQPFLKQLLVRFPQADFLIGKPFPVVAVAGVLEASREQELGAVERIQWLVDTRERLMQYLELAKEQKVCLKISIELDVGLHRGGLNQLWELEPLLQVIAENPDNLKFSGFMGYEPQLAKVPFFLANKQDEIRKSVMDEYREFVDFVRLRHPDLYSDDLCFNAGGSMTYRLYQDMDSIPANEIALGSAFVKPVDFDLDTLDVHQEAAFIATPVLKSDNQMNIPFLEKLSPLWKSLTPNMAKSFYIYGGWWKAKPVSPKGLSNNPIFGRSTNQELFMGSEKTDLKVDDFVFLRPTQSEYVFLHFGRILLVRKGEVVGEWATFNQDY